jgi:hypothetical protein
MQAASTCTVDTACLTWIKDKLQLVSVQWEAHIPSACSVCLQL